MFPLLDGADNFVESASTFVHHSILYVNPLARMMRCDGLRRKMRTQQDAVQDLGSITDVPRLTCMYPSIPHRTLQLASPTPRPVMQVRAPEGVL